MNSTRMKTGRVLASLALAASLSGCADGVPPWRQAPYPWQSFDTVYMERSGCYGPCPVYDIEISGDGRVRFTGKAHVKTVGTVGSRLRPHDLALLARAVRNSGFTGWRSSYQNEEDGCESVFTDAPSVTIAVVRKGKTQHVTYYYGCLGAAVPIYIDALSGYIDWIAGTEKWIGK